MKRLRQEMKKGFKQLLNHAFRLLVVVFIAAFFAGCAAAPERQRFTLQEAQPNTATIYHYRLPAFKGSAGIYYVLSNGIPLTGIGNGGFFKEVVEPGQIEYHTKNRTDKKMYLLGNWLALYLSDARQDYEVAYTLNVEAGKLYFLKWINNRSRYRPTIEQVTQQEALQQLSELQSFFPVQTSKKAELIAALKDKHENVRWNAAWLLGNIKDPLATEPLNAVLNELMAAVKNENEHWMMRAKASRTLGKIGDLRAVDPLIAALKDKDKDVRWNAAWALGNIKDSRAVDPLIAALKDKDEDVRRNAALALGKIGDPRAIELLITALKDEDKDVRWSAALALGNIKDSRAVDPLIAALKDEYKDMRWNAAWALGKITGKNFGQDPAKWQAWWAESKSGGVASP